MKAPNRKVAVICLLLFIVGLIGYFVPLGGVPLIGSVLAIVNHLAAFILMFGYGLLLLAVYVL